MARKKYFKPRFIIMIACGIYMALFCGINARSFPAGLLIAAAGITVRLWASGYVVKCAKLTTSGPYAFIRHPLYLGTTMIYWGFIVMLGAFSAGLVFFVPIWWAYRKSMEREDSYLLMVYGDEFRNYKREVLPFTPRITPYGGGEKWKFELRRIVLDHKEHKIPIWVAIIVVVFLLKREVLSMNNGMSATAALLAMALFVLLLFDAGVDLWRNKYKARHLYGLS